MRAVLAVSVLLTAVVAWAAAAAPAAPKRATPVALAPVENVESEFVPLAVAVEEPPALIEVSAGDGKWAAIEAEALPASWIPLDLVVVDGESGERQHARQAIATAESRPRDQMVWRSSTHVRRGDDVTVAATVLAMAGHVPDGGGAYGATAYVSRRAERVRMLAPLRREADVSLRVTDAAGRPVAGAQVNAVTLSGGEPTVFHDVLTEEELPEPVAGNARGAGIACSAAPTDADGLTRLRGIPHLLDERFWIVAGVEGNEGHVELRLGALGSARTAGLRLPEAPSRVDWGDESIGCLSGCGGRRNLRAGCRRYVPARLEVVVFRRDGGVAKGVPVVLGLHQGATDEDGRAVFEELRPDTYDLEVRDPDFVWSKAPVKLEDGESRIVEVLEPSGWTARATLLDSMGRRVPFARVDVWSMAPVDYVRVEDGVQDLAFYTDENGEIALPRLHHTPVRLQFDYGSRREYVTIEESDPFAMVRLPPP